MYGIWRWGGEEQDTVPSLAVDGVERQYWWRLEEGPFGRRRQGGGIVLYGGRGRHLCPVQLTHDKHVSGQLKYQSAWDAPGVGLANPCVRQILNRRDVWPARPKGGGATVETGAKKTCTVWRPRCREQSGPTGVLKVLG